MEAESKAIIQSCFINGKTCRNGKRDDFDVNPQTGEKFTCNKWVKLVGMDPQTGTTIDTWCCNEFAKIKLMIEGANMTRHAIASTDKVASEVAKQHMTMFAALPESAQARVANANPKLLPTPNEETNGHQP